VKVDLIKVVVLGILQGLSEFLPISSSGHLVIAEHLMNFSESGLAFEVFVHFGSLLAVLWVFRKEIIQLLAAIPAIFRLSSPELDTEKRSYALLDIYIIIASIPAALIGIFFEEQIAIIFENHIFAFVMLFITGLIVWSSRYAREKNKAIGSGSSFLIGCAQAIAILPGISRSGSTIVTALWLGIPRETAAKFSFLMSVPVILGATVLKVREVFLNPLSQSELGNLILASLAALISGYFAIRWLLEIIRRKKLEWFGLYCMVVSLLGLTYHLFA
jgi:undecaprenyl-diphosphatase